MATEILINSINDMLNRDTVKCVSKIDHFKFHQYALIPAILITLSFAMLRKRRNVLLSVLWGRPGLPVPMDSMTRVARISYACAFGATTNLVYQIVVTNQYAIDGSVHPTWKTVIAVVSVFIYGMVFYPLFASLAIGSVFGYGLGTLYVWMLTAIEIYRLAECDTNVVGRTAIIFRNLPLLLCLGYLSFSIPIRVYRAAKKGRLLVWECDLEVKDRMNDIVNSHEGRHITKLLHKPAVTVVGGQRLGWQYTVFSWIHRQRYRWRKGFRYPSRLLSVILVGMMVVYMVSVELLVMWLIVPDSSQQPSKPSMDLLNYPNSTFASLHETLMKIANTLRVSSILSCILAFIFSLGNALHMLACFRRNLVALYKGDHTNIPKAISFNYSMLCLGCLKFGGFQVAYIMSGFLVQWQLLFISLCVISFFIVYPEFLVFILQGIWPWLLSLVIMLLLQRLLVIFFLQERGRYLALDNRGSYFVFTYFMFFYNMFVGLGSCAARLFQSMVIGTFIMSRLDYSLMPNKFENWDPGFSAYVGYMQMEYAHTHPVLQIFTRLLLVERNGGSMNCDEFSSLSEMGACGGVGSRSSKVCGRVRRKWHVLYTLVRNPSLVYTRKVFNQTIASRTLATRPNTDSGPPPQNVCVSLA